MICGAQQLILLSKNQKYMQATELKEGQIITCASRGNGKVIKRTPLTVTVKFRFSTVRWRF